MALYEEFVGRNREDFATLEDLNRNYTVTAPENFNFAYDVVDRLAREEPEKLAMLWVGDDKSERRFTFRDLSLLSNQAANLFRSVGVNKGDRVLVVLRRGYQFWYTLLGLHKLGAVAIPATHQLVAKDYIYRCNAAGVVCAVITGDDDATEHFDEAVSQCETLKTRLVTKHKMPGCEWLDFDALLEQQPDTFDRVPTQRDEMSLMFFSSGTTGYPKMVWHSYTYPLGHILTGCFWHAVEENGLHFTISDTGWGKALWGKIYGQWLGGSAVFVYDFKRFNAHDILTMIEKYNITTFCAPPTMYRYMIKEDLSQYNLSSLHHCTTAGEALNPEVFNQWRKKTGLRIYEGFGQTETTLCCWTAYPWMQPRLGSMGLPAPGWRIIIADPDGKECPAGVTGEICVRTDEAGGGKPFGLFGGYYRAEEQTRAAWHDDLYHTGDTAYRDELGFLWYVGRVDDVIKSSGYRIGPFEVESAIMEHPAVLECAVTGVPDPDRGFVVKATIVLTKGYVGTPELTKEIQNHVKHATAPYKYPRIVEYVNELPKTISGKIRRVAIREMDNAKAKAT